MKKTVIFIVMAALCLNFGNIASAQTPENKAVDITAKGIKVGEKVPDIPILSKYRGKLIILDFWATWCSPCVAMIPKMEALQTQFKDQIQIIPVTYQAEKEVIPFLEKLHKGEPSVLPQVTGDKELHRLFPHVYMPHYIWIDKEGSVSAITGMEEISSDNIKAIMSAPATILKQKTDLKVTYSKDKPLLLNGNGGTQNSLINRSLLTGYMEGLTGRISTGPISDNQLYKISALNVPLLTLFKSAYNSIDEYFTNNRVIIEVNEPERISSDLRGNAYREWLKVNGYCYELIIPAKSYKSANRYMQEDIERMFTKYEVKREKRKMHCIALERTSEQNKIESKGGIKRATITPHGCTLNNMPLNRIIWKMNVLYFQNSASPVIDATNYKLPVDISFTANMTDIKSINNALASYNLQFVEKDMLVDVLTIKDKEVKQ